MLTRKKNFMVKWIKKHWEVLSYLIFGVLTTLLNIVLYALFNRLFGYTAANSWGNVLDNILCILFAYTTNRAFVFNSKTRGRAMAKEFGAFVTCRLGTMLLDTAIMLVLGNLLAVQGAGLCRYCRHRRCRRPHGNLRYQPLQCAGTVGAVCQGVLECDRCGAELCVQQADHL